MLLRMHCIRDRKCETCDFESECLVRRTLYSRMDIQPAFMSKGDSVGYVIECENEKESFAKGDELCFNLLLFGKTIVYFSQFLQAFHQLGVHGLGKYKAKFSISRITNTLGKDILDGSDIYMKNVEVMRLAEYISYRKEKLENEGETYRLRIVLRSPLTMKYRGTLLDSFDMEAFMQACARRVFMINCFEGNGTEQTDLSGHIPQLIAQESRHASVRRYSSTHDEKIRLEGFYGHSDIEKVDETALELLIAGELLHVGKNTSFGFGRYRVVQI